MLPAQRANVLRALLFASSIAATAQSAAIAEVLARKVDESQPYYSRVKLQSDATRADGVGPLAALTAALSRHYGGGVRMLVKNNLQVLVSDADAAELTPDDRLEVWLLGSGVATRAETLAAFAVYGPEGERWRMQAVTQRERQRMEQMAKQGGGKPAGEKPKSKKARIA